jgi:hypothetical protein
MLHWGERRTLTTKQVRETEAEAVAFVVCQAIGLATGTASQDYIRLWHGDAKLLRESLEAIQSTAAVILGGIAPEPAPTPETLSHIQSPIQPETAAVVEVW